jgi:N-acetylmuramic acid 6-phosphate (MurNAc-6-P) etherase
LRARERGEDTDSEEDEEEVDADTERDDLESEDMLIGIHSSLQGSGPFPYHGGEGASERLVEMGRTVGLP